VTVDFDDCRIDHRVFHVGIITQGVKYPFEYITLDPTTEPSKRAVPIPELRWKVAPWRIRADNPQHSLKEKPRIAPRPSRRTRPAGTQRLNQFPLPVREDKSALVHSNLLFWKVESETLRIGNPKCPQA
jgi:hypothetical protein